MVDKDTSNESIDMTDQELKEKLLEIAHDYDDGVPLYDLQNRIEELLIEAQRQYDDAKGESI